MTEHASPKPPAETPQKPAQPDRHDPEPTLEGKVAPFDSVEASRAALEEAFDYRGDVTIELTSGETVEGFIFNRDVSGPDPETWTLRVFPKHDDAKRTLRVVEVAGLRFTGKDTARGKSFERWMEKYRAKKLAEQAAARS